MKHWPAARNEEGMMSAPTKKSSYIDAGSPTLASFRAARKRFGSHAFGATTIATTARRFVRTKASMSKRPLCQCGSAHRVRDTLDTEESARM